MKTAPMKLQSAAAAVAGSSNWDQIGSFLAKDFLGNKSSSVENMVFPQ